MKKARLLALVLMFTMVLQMPGGLSNTAYSTDNTGTLKKVNTELTGRLSRLNTAKSYKSELSKLISLSSTEDPATLDCTYKLKDNVVVLKNSELAGLLANTSGNEGFDRKTAEDKITSTFSAKKSLVEKYLPKTNGSKIYYDEVSNICASMDYDTSASSETNCVFKRPQMTDVVSDLTLNPEKKTVRLNKANIRYGSKNGAILQALEEKNKSVSSSGVTVKSGSLGAIVDIEIPEDSPLFEGYTNDGTPYQVDLSGHFKISSIDVSGSYGVFSGYELMFSTGLDIELKAKFTAFKGTIAIPLYALNIPAGPAHVGGGIYLIINNQGQFNLAVNASAQLRATAGIHGSTWFGVPTSIHPVFEPTFDFSAKPEFNGQVQGDITVGPLAQINIFGFDIVAANVGIGAGVYTKAASDNFLDCDVYGLIGANASIFDMGIELINFRLPLYHFRKEDMMGYDLEFYDIDAYTKHISGKLTYEGTPGKLEPDPLQNAEITINVERANSKHGDFTSLKVKTNEQGQFETNINQELYKGDIVTISNIYNPLRGKNEQPNFKPAYPSIPFDNPVMSYVDFFNDEVRGKVSPAFIKNKITGEGKVVYFDKPIDLYFQPHKNNTGRDYKLDNTHKKINPSNGVFSYKTDVKPYDLAQAVIYYNDFVLPSYTIASDTNFSATRVVVEKSSEKLSNGSRRDKSREFIFITNMRGSKPLQGLATYKPMKYDYKHIENEFFSTTSSVVELKNIFRNIVPSASKSNLPQPFSQKLKIENRRPDVDTSVSKYKNVLQEVKESEDKAVSVVETNFNVFWEPTLKPDRQPTSNKKIEADKGSQSLNSISWKGDYAKLVVNIEGENVVIHDVNDQDPGNSSSGKGQASNSVEARIMETVFSVINPNPVERVNQNIYDTGLAQPKVVNTQSKWTVNWINKAEKNKLISNSKSLQFSKSITREEFCALLVTLNEKLTRNTIKYNSGTFKDTKSTVALKAAKIGIVKPDASRRFLPNAAVSRQEAYSMITKCLKSAYPTLNTRTPTGKSVKTTDAKQIAGWALEGVNYCINNKISIDGSGKAIQPLKSVTNEEAVALVEMTYEQF